VIGLALLLLADLGGGLLTGREGFAEQRRPDPTLAYRYVAAHHVPGEPVIVGWPPTASLIFGDRADLRFLVGEKWRLGRYTRLDGDGRLVDEFIGSEAIASVTDLCELLAVHPGTWLVADFLDEAERPVITGAAQEVFRTSAGVRVFRSDAPAAWRRSAVKTCTSLFPTGDSGSDPQGSDPQGGDHSEKTRS
jgi:hypothetical protein